MARNNNALTEIVRQKLTAGKGTAHGAGTGGKTAIRKVTRTNNVITLEMYDEGTVVTRTLTLTGP